MKLFAKLMLAILVIGVLLPFTLLKNENGEPLLSVSDLKPAGFTFPELSLPDMPDFSRRITQGSQSGDLAGKDLFYKWHDAEGNVQFTTEPPPTGVDYTVKGFDPNANVIQAVKVKPEEAEQDEPRAQQKVEQASDISSPYSKESIEKLFDDAEGLQKLLAERLQKQESITGQ